MALFDAGGARGFNLESAYKYLRYIPPSSVESERAFSAAGYLCSKLRTRLRHGLVARTKLFTKVILY